jgi:hypothetical protein
MKGEKTKTRFGFRSKYQMPIFMVWREYWEYGEMVFAKVIFKIG